MAGPAEMRNPRHADDDGDLQLAWIGRRRARGLQQQLLDSGRACMLLGALVLTWDQLALASSSSPAEHVLLAAFVLWLLGAALVMLSLVSRRFPRLASAGAALVMALRNYLLGGGGL